MIKKFFNYTGSKKFFIEDFKKLESYTKKESKIYIEPFLGSGICFLNTSDHYDKYILNDSNPYVVSIFYAFKELNYTDLIDLKYDVFKTFGDIKKCKECYYNFRNWVNETFKLNSYEHGIYYYFLANACINSMFRIGPNGFNQSFGKRFSFLNEKEFDYVKNKLQKAEIYNTTEYEFLIKDTSEEFIFFDPPYYEPKSKTNVGYSFNKDDYINFINIIKSLKNSKFIYTDTLKKENKNFNKKVIREMKNVSPNRKKEIITNEYVFISDTLNIEDINILEEQKHINKLF